MEPVRSSRDIVSSEAAVSDFSVVGIGASAGGIGALKKFFEHLPSDSGMAFVVILHLSEQHESNLAEILQKTTANASCAGK